MVSRTLRLAVHGSLVLAVLSVWQYAPNSLLPRELVSTPGEVLPRLAVFVTSGDAFVHLGATSYATFLGIGIGGVAGVVLALASRTRYVGRLIDALMHIGYAIPKVVLIAVFVLFFGIGFASRVVLVVSFIAFVLYFNVSKGLTELDRSTLNTLSLFGASRYQLARIYTLPAVLGYVLSGMRVAFPLAYSVAVFSELAYGGERGIGAFISQSARTMQPSGTIVGIISAGILGYVLDRFIVHLVHTRATRTGAAVVAV
jgi:NitT/TauT family transport system permease protein